MDNLDCIIQGFNTSLENNISKNKENFIWECAARIFSSNMNPNVQSVVTLCKQSIAWAEELWEVLNKRKIENPQQSIFYREPLSYFTENYPKGTLVRIEYDNGYVDGIIENWYLNRYDGESIPNLRNITSMNYSGKAKNILPIT